MSDKTKKILSFSLTTLGLVLLLIGSLSAFFIIKPYNFNKGQEISEELRQAKEKFKLELDKKTNEYYILGIKDDYQKTKVVTIPESIDGILVTKLLDEEESFSSYRYISELVISKNIKYIGSSRKDYLAYRDALEGATGLSKITVSEDNLVFASIDGVLYSKDLETLIKFPNALAFGESSLTFELPEHVKYINSKAFYLNDLVEQIIFNDGLISVGSNAFYGCNKLEDVIFNEGLEKISDSAFEQCKSLSSIKLPTSLTSVGKSAFKGCSNLRTIEILSTNLDLEDSSIFNSITNLDSWSINIIIPVENTELIYKFSDYSFVKSLGLTGLSVDYQRFIVLNGKFSVVSDNVIEYLDTKPHSKYE